MKKVQKTNISEVSLDLDLISQMANSIYQEDIIGANTQDSIGSIEANIPLQVNSFSKQQEDFIKKEPPHQGAIKTSKKQELCHLNQERFIPDLMPTDLPEKSIMPKAPQLYFLQSTKDDFQKKTMSKNLVQQSIGALDPFNVSSDSFLKESFQLASKIYPVSKTQQSETNSHFQEGIKITSQADFYFQQLQQPMLSTLAKDEIHKHVNNDTPPCESNADWSAFRMFNPDYIRKDFPVLQQKVNGQPLVWLDNGATTQKPQSVIDALNDFYSNYNSNIHRGAHTLAARATDAYENTREKIRNLIGAASKDEIIYVRGTTEGINLIANTFGRQRIGPGDEILISELEHHANIIPWQLLAKEKGAKLRMIPINDRGDIMLDSYERLFNQKTKLVAVGQISNTIGTVLPIKEMIETAHRYDVPVIVDGAQSVQHMPVNVQELDADFFVFSGHKIFAPTGIGAVYGKKEHLEKMPPWQGGGNMIDQVTFEETTYNNVPALFEAGTPSIGDAIGLGKAIDYVQNIGMENIHRYETELMTYLTHSLQGIPGLTILVDPAHRAGALSFVMKDISTDAIGQFLDKEGIAVRSGHHCAQPALRRFGQTSSVRPSLAFYNTKEDIDRLRAAILNISLLKI